VASVSPLLDFPRELFLSQKFLSVRSLSRDSANSYPLDSVLMLVLTALGIPLIRIESRGRFEPKELAAVVQKGIADFYAKPI
jgi:hypothetical protein